jgi:multimeric flavodoxin WrbA
MKALILNCSLKSSPEPSSTGALADMLGEELRKLGVTAEPVRVADLDLKPGVTSDEGPGDDWPDLRHRILDAEILVLASPTWVGRLSSIAQRVIERMDAMLAETDDAGRPVAFNHVAGFVAVGNEDGAKHVIGEMIAALVEIGFTIPGQPWTYYNQGAPMGPVYLEGEDADKERPHQNAALAAHTLTSVARALQATPIPPQ